jgi:hypothetical protein
LLAFTLFPSGRFHPRWWGWCVAAWTPIGLMVVHPALTWLPSRTGFAAAIGAHYAIALVGIVQQYRHTATAEQRVQVKWALWGMIGGFNIALGAILVRGLTQQQPGDPFVHVLANLAGVIAFFLSLVVLDVGFAFSILRYRLWDIDVLVNRSIVYGALTGLLMTFVGGSLLMISRLFEQMTGGQQSMVAVAVASPAFGLVFQPTRRRALRFVDRAFYGIAIDYERAAPAAPASSSLQTTTQIGAFANLQLVGRGGMADVYRGELPTLKRPVAIKVLPAVLADSPGAAGPVSARSACDGRATASEHRAGIRGRASERAAVSRDGVHRRARSGRRAAATYRAVAGGGTSNPRSNRSGIGLCPWAGHRTP